LAHNLRNATALVTGAGRGIGRAICLALADAGTHVFAAARTEDEIKAVADEIIESGGNATAIPADVADEDQVSALFSEIRGRQRRLDILINNAGIGIYGPVVDTSAADLDRILAVNVRGTFLCSREAMKLMIPQESGYIINIASVVGFKGYPNQAVYTAGKHAVMGLTKSLAVEAQRYGIRVSAILPGGVDTDLVRRSRPDLDASVLMHPEDIAHAVMYLLSLSDRAAVDQIYIRRRAAKPF